MVNRILSILKDKNITASQFADMIDVQRSSMSHIMSGRNNPSLDFVNKILVAFPDIDTDWLIFGKGNMYKSKALTNENLINIEAVESKSIDFTNKVSNPIMLDLFDTSNVKETNIVDNSENSKIETFNEDIIEKDININIIEDTALKSAKIDSNDNIYYNERDKILKDELDFDKNSIKDKKIEKILVFYIDKTFREYKPE